MLQLGVALVLELVQLHAFEVLHFADVLFQLLDFVQQALDFEVLGGGLSRALGLVLDLPGLDFALLLVDELGHFLVLAEELGVVFEDELNLVFQLGHFLVLVSQESHFLSQSVVFSLERPDNAKRTLLVELLRPTVSLQGGSEGAGV